MAIHPHLELVKTVGEYFCRSLMSHPRHHGMTSLSLCPRCVPLPDLYPLFHTEAELENQTHMGLRC